MRIFKVMMLIAMSALAFNVYAQITISDLANDEGYDGAGLVVLLQLLSGIAGMIFLTIGAIKAFTGGFERGAKQYLWSGLAAVILLAILSYI